MPGQGASYSVEREYFYKTQNVVGFFVLVRRGIRNISSQTWCRQMSYEYGTPRIKSYGDAEDVRSPITRVLHRSALIGLRRVLPSFANA